MANKSSIQVIRGKLDWAKIVGKPRPHTGDPKYDKGPFWSVDVTPNEEGVAQLKGLLSKKHFAEKLKEPKGKDTRKEDFLQFRHLATNKDGEPNDPVKVVDAQGNPWPQNKLIGNGTVADVKYKIVDYGTTVGMYIQAVRILQHVPYGDSADGGFAPLSEDDEFFAAGSDDAPAEPQTKTEPTEDDDDIPF